MEYYAAIKTGNKPTKAKMFMINDIIIATLCNCKLFVELCFEDQERTWRNYQLCMWIRLHHGGYVEIQTKCQPWDLHPKRELLSMNLHDFSRYSVKVFENTLKVSQVDDNSVDCDQRYEEELLL